MNRRAGFVSTPGSSATQRTGQCSLPAVLAPDKPFVRCHVSMPLVTVLRNSMRLMLPEHCLKRCRRPAPLETLQPNGGVGLRQLWQRGGVAVWQKCWGSQLAGKVARRRATHAGRRGRHNGGPGAGLRGWHMDGRSGCCCCWGRGGRQTRMTRTATPPGVRGSRRTSQSTARSSPRLAGHRSRAGWRPAFAAGICLRARDAARRGAARRDAARRGAARRGAGQARHRRL